MKKFVSIDQYMLDNGYRVNQGILAFVDMSGFTALTEQLTASGKEGTEELTSIINQYFDAMLNIIKKYDGNAIKFAGDAILYYFSSKQDFNESSNEMMKVMEDFSSIDTSQGVFNLGMKIVGAEGKWHEFVVGDSRQSGIFLSGDLLKEIAALEDSAKSGEIIFSRKRFDVEKIDIPPYSSEIKAFVSEDIAFRKQELTSGEHRPAVSIFIRLDNYNENRPDIYMIQQIFSDIIDIVTKYKGHIQLLDNIHSKGSKIFMLFGAPFSYGNDLERAVDAAIEIFQRINAYIGQLELRSGINYGYVYAGLTGNSWRQQYTVLGDIVNTSARLTNTADNGEIIVSNSVRRNLKNRYQFKELPEVSVKGKKSAIKRFSPLKKKFVNIRKTFIGRKKEINDIMNDIHSEMDLIIINGEAGIGKSMILDKIASQCMTEGINVLRGQTDELKPTYYSFASVIKRAASIIDDDSIEQKRKKLIDHIKNIASVNNNDYLLNRIVFIARMLFGLPFKDDYFDRLNPKLKKDNLIDTLRHYFSLQGRCVVILDDFHYGNADDLSAVTKIIKMLGTDVNQTVFLLSGRPELKEDMFGEVEKRTFHKITQMNKKDCTDIMAVHLNEYPLSESIKSTIEKKTSGNPFYIEQMIMYLRENNLISLIDGKWEATEEFRENMLPENVFSMIISRIDRLSEKTKQSVRVASALGIDFNISIIDTMLNRDIDRDLMEANRERIVYRDAVDEMKYIFSHAVIRDVVYDSILRSRRKQIHENIAETFKKEFADNEEDVYHLLAYHYDKSEIYVKASPYYLKAGIKAKDVFSSKEALVYLERFFELQQYADSNAYVDASYAKGELYSLIGDYQKGIECYKQGYENADNELKKAKGIIQTGISLRMKGDYEEAMNYFEQAESHINGESDEVYHLMNDIYCEKSWIYKILSRYEESIKFGMKVLDLAEKVRDKKLKYTLRSSADGVLGMTYLDTGELKKARDHLNRQIESQQKYSNDIRSQALAYSNLGIVYGEMGRIDEAAGSFRQYMELSERIGYKRGVAVSSGNLGIIYAMKKDWKRAEELFQKYLRITSETGNKRGQTIARRNLGNLYKSTGDLKKAEECFSIVLKESFEIGDRRTTANSKSDLGIIYHMKDKDKKAELFLREGIEIMRELKNRYEIVEPLILLASIIMDGKRDGRFDEGMKMLQEAKNYTEQINNIHMKASVMLIIAKYNALYDNTEESERVFKDAMRLVDEVDDNELREEAERVRRVIDERKGV